MSPAQNSIYIKSGHHRESRDSTKCEEERVPTNIRERSAKPHGIPQNLSEKIREICDPQPEIPEIESVIISELCDSSTCESESLQHNIRYMSDSPPTISHNQNERISESTKCEIEVIHEEDREMSAPPPNIPYNESESISELLESTKCDVEVDQDENREMRSTKNNSTQ